MTSGIGIRLAFLGAAIACAEPGQTSPEARPAPSSASGRSKTEVSEQPEPPPRPVAPANAVDAGASPRPPRPSAAGAATLGAISRPGAPASVARDADAELAPELLGPDGAELPQTRERPQIDSPGLRLRLERLVDAIAHDDPERALPAFFPRAAYARVKAVADPARDWQERLVRAFQRDIHDYHRELGAGAAGARLAGITCNERAVRWMEPGSEGNRLGYYRVTRSRLRLKLADGTQREFPLTSLISWRGAWYVVHLNGFSRGVTATSR